jgi:hypothetical protein
MNKIYLIPSFYSHIINGVFLFIAFILLYKDYVKIIHLEHYQLISLMLLFSMSIGIHGLTHLGLEKSYGYNPMSIIYA